MTRFAFVLLTAATLNAATGLIAASATTLIVAPATVELKGPEARQQLLAEATTDTNYQEDWTKTSTWTSSNPQVVKVDAKGALTPVSDGEATVTATQNNITATTKVKVVDNKAQFTWNFRNHVMPVLTKAGCNQGACHGALSGKNGFKLTLRGYDPELDYDVLTRQSIARRISLANPTESLLLQKPVMSIPHGGGLRFKKDSLEYRIIAEWIASGTPPPSSKDKEMAAIEVFPAAAMLKPGAEQQLIVRARYTDGSLEDVTRWVKYTSNNESVATVDDNGKVKITGAGESAVTLWYNSKVLYARVTSPYPNTVDASAYTKFPRSNYIDDLVIAKLKTLNIAPSAAASDATYIRRAFLDAAGILPTAEEVEQYLSDKAPDKRAKLVDQLLKREEFTDYWAYKWSDLLLVSSKKLRPTATRAFYNWIRDSVAENKPWDKFTREIFTATGSSRENGALNYFVLHKDPIELTENVTQAFLGQRLTCARCHNHPLEKWTQKQYYQMANLFSRVGVKNGNTADDSIIFAKTTGDINHPRLLRPLAPTPLDGKSMELDAQTDRRAWFAAWLTSPENEGFARSVVNRVWGNFLGRGLVHPIDDVRATNPASNEELFQAVTKDFVTHGFDIKHLVRTIMLSSTYGLSAEANATNAKDDVFYSKYIVKRLPAEVLLDTMSQVTGVPTAFANFPAGTRAMQLPDTQVTSQFLNVFGRPARIICDASERSVDPTIAQALHVINGDTLNKKLSSPDGYLNLLLKLGLSDTRILEHITLSSLGRYPTESEKTNLPKLLAMKGNARREALEDLTWALLTGKEFLFNH